MIVGPDHRTPVDPVQLPEACVSCTARVVEQDVDRADVHDFLRAALTEVIGGDVDCIGVQWTIIRGHPCEPALDAGIVRLGVTTTV